MWKLMIFLLGFAIASGIVMVGLYGLESPSQEPSEETTKAVSTGFIDTINQEKVAAKDDKKQANADDSKTFMERKLTASKSIIEGLSRADFDLVEKYAQDLMLISQEANWKVLNTKPYLKMSADFRSSAERMRDAANEKNLDGATLAYFEVTLSCVRCHKYIRNHK